MKEIRIGKITVNMGIGEGGEKLVKAENLLEELTGQKPTRTYSKISNPTFAIRKGLPIGCKVTLRNGKIEKFLKQALEGREYTIKKSSFDDHGNVSFGIREHIDLPGTRYDPKVGIFGFELAITMERPGYRIKRRKLESKKVSKKHEIKKEEAIKFMEDVYGIKLEE